MGVYSPAESVVGMLIIGMVAACRWVGGFGESKGRVERVVGVKVELAMAWVRLVVGWLGWLGLPRTGAANGEGIGVGGEGLYGGW